MPREFIHVSNYHIGQKVIIDGDSSIVATVIAIMFEGQKNHPQYQVGFVANSGSVLFWTFGFRLSEYVK